MYKIKPRRMLYGHVSTLTYYALVLIYTSSIRLDCFYIQLSSRDIYFISCHLSYLLNIKMQIYIYVLLYVRHSDLIQSNWNKKKYPFMHIISIPTNPDPNLNTNGKPKRQSQGRAMPKCKFTVRSGSPDRYHTMYRHRAKTVGKVNWKGIER